jgi:hypothetical protein
MSSLQALLHDPDLAALDARPPPFDPLEALGIARHEPSRTRLVAWLLDPEPLTPGQDHGLGTAFLEHLARAAFGCELHVARPSVVLWRESAVGDGSRATARAPDLRCAFHDGEGRPHLLVLEHKVLAPESDRQVRDYLAWAQGEHPGARRMLVYVTLDGRAPEGDPEGVVSWTWAQLAQVGLDALDALGGTPETPARAFARSVLAAWRTRHGGDPDTLEHVRALHRRHPAAARRAASPGAFDDPAVEPLRSARRTACWYLQNIQARRFPWTRAWTEEVSRAFARRHPQAPRLVPGAPHEGAPYQVSWSLEGVSDALGLYLQGTRDRGGPRFWASLRSPGLDARGLFARRDQLQAVGALPEPTRSWLLEARPREGPEGAWRWLQAGPTASVPRGFTPRDQAMASAEALQSLVGAHLASLVAFARDPSQRLFSADLDGDHQQPIDLRDREALAREASPRARRLLVLLRTPTGHLAERRLEGLLCAAWSALYGGEGTFAYDYLTGTQPPPEGFARELVARLSLFDGPEDPTLAEALGAVDRAVARGATVLLLGDRCDAPTVARRLCQTALGAPFLPGLTAREFPVGEGLAERAAGAGAVWAPCVQDAKRLAGCVALAPAEGVTVDLWLRLGDGERVPWTAWWRAGASTVRWWAGGGVGAWAGPFLSAPEVLSRWWRALGEGDTLGPP